MFPPSRMAGQTAYMLSQFGQRKKGLQLIMGLIRETPIHTWHALDKFASH